MNQRRSVSSGSPYEPLFGFCRARHCFEIIRDALRELGATMVQVSRLIDPEWRVEFEADAQVRE